MIITAFETLINFKISIQIRLVDVSLFCGIQRKEIRFYFHLETKKHNLKVWFIDG